MDAPAPRKIGARDGGTATPFPGLASYDISDQRYFKGREQETAELARWIQARPLTIITGGSGNGKTSLLHAGLAPLFLEAGIDIVITEPGGSAPVLELGKALLSRLVVNKKRALQLIGALIARYGPDLNLREARAKPDVQEVIAARWPVGRPLDHFKGGVLRTWLTFRRMADRPLRMAFSALETDGAEWPGLEAPLSDLEAWLKLIPADADVSELDESLAHDPAATAGLIVKLVANIMQRRAEAAPRERMRQQELRDRGDDDGALAVDQLILVVDQFEEIFVQYGDGSGARINNRGSEHRKTLIEVIEVIAGHHLWPIRVVLSLRKEHYADLQSALGNPHDLSANGYHLGALRKEDSRAALGQLAPHPPREPDIEWEDWADGAIDALANENDDNSIDAVQLSILGHWLWHRDFPLSEPFNASQPMASHLTEVLDVGGPIAGSAAERQEALDVLFQMIVTSRGSGGRRISVPEPDLYPFWRSATLRRALISALHAAKLIRPERRGALSHWQISHERMIPILEGLQLKWPDSELSSLGLQLKRLSDQFVLRPFDSAQLDRAEAHALWKNLRRIEIPPSAASWLVYSLLSQQGFEDWDAWACELLRQLMEMASEPNELRERSRWGAGWSMDATDLGSPLVVAQALDPIEGLDATVHARWILTSCLNHASDPAILMQAARPALTGEEL